MLWFPNSRASPAGVYRLRLAWRGSTLAQELLLHQQPFHLRCGSIRETSVLAAFPPAGPCTPKAHSCPFFSSAADSNFLAHSMHFVALTRVRLLTLYPAFVFSPSRRLKLALAPPAFLSMCSTRGRLLVRDDIVNGAGTKVQD